MKHSSQISLPASAGFTLVELLVTVSIAALLLGIATPSYKGFVIRNQITSYTNELITSINLARSEAVRRGRPSVICPSDDDGETCSGTWNDGWLLFSDLNSDGAFDDGDYLLKVHSAVATNYGIDGGEDLATLTYGADGATAMSGVFVVCHNERLEGAKALVITRLRPRVATDTDDDRVPNDDTGNNIGSCTSEAEEP